MLNEKKLLHKMEELVLHDPANRLEEKVSYYDAPLLGIASASDTLFTDMKKEGVIGTHYLLPAEWLPGAASVIVYFLPFTKEIRHSNYSSGLVSTEWLHARFRGEEFNNCMRRLIISEIDAVGGRAVAPVLQPEFTTDYEVCTSNWSERHAAYIAGLGTFSLNKGLITAKGMAGRFGSVITDLPLTPTKRDYDSPFQYCPAISDGSCGICIERCPVSCITPEGKNKITCHHYLFIEDPVKETKERFGYPYSTCGKCYTNVPCEDRIP